jgi:hypothetical protein
MFLLLRLGVKSGMLGVAHLKLRNTPNLRISENLRMLVRFYFWFLIKDKGALRFHGGYF